MRFLFLFLIFILFYGNVSGQWRPSPADFFEEAEEYFMYEEYKEALPLYLRINEPDSLPAFIRYRVGICYLKIPGREFLSIPHLEFAAKNISASPLEGGLTETKAPGDVLLYLGTAYRHMNETGKAIASFKQYIHLTNDPVMAVKAGRELEKTNTAALFIKNAEKINALEVISKMGLMSGEFNIAISGDETTLAFASQQKFYDAVFYTKLENNIWIKPKNITPQVGSDGDAYPLSLSYDGKTMLLYRSDPGTNGDIYLSRFENDKWSKMELLPAPVNTEYFETYASLSSDGQTIYFSSNRPGGFGGMDIYKSASDEKGSWGPAVNLGAQVNTMEDEITPFLSKDGKYLFFSSGGHTNIGGFDVFYSQKLDDGSWTQAFNPGYPLNTTGDDKFLIPVGSVPEAYYEFLVDKQNMTREFMKISNFINNRVVSVKVGIEIKESYPGLSASLPTTTLTDTRNQKTLKSISGFPENGTIEINLEPGYYEVSVSNKKYKTTATEFTIERYYPEPEKKIALQLEPVPVEFRLSNLYFGFDNHQLADTEKSKLEELIRFLNNYRDFNIQLMGYTDITGDRNYNKLLAGKRALMVAEYLSAKGIDKNRISTVSVGPENFVATNDLPEGRKFNRRVEIIIPNRPGFIQVEYIKDIPENLLYKKK